MTKFTKLYEPLSATELANYWLERFRIAAETLKLDLESNETNYGPMSAKAVERKDLPELRLSLETLRMDLDEIAFRNHGFRTMQLADEMGAK